MKEGFSKKELEEYRKAGLDAILQKTVSGFNYYPNSIEKEFKNMIHIPIKYGHRNTQFLDLLKKEAKTEFKNYISIKTIPRKVIYQWLKTYNFPKPEERIRIFDIEKNAYLNNAAEYKNASNKLLAEGDEQSLLFIPKKNITLIDLALFLLKKGSFYLTDKEGRLIPSQKDSPNKFEINPDRISDEAYMTPMIVTGYSKSLETDLNGFFPVKKLLKIKGNEEISVYLDKNYTKFKERCKIQFENPVLKLANRLFRDFINFEESF